MMMLTYVRYYLFQLVSCNVKKKTDSTFWRRRGTYLYNEELIQFHTYLKLVLFLPLPGL